MRREECEGGTKPAVERQIKSVSRPSIADGYLPATEGSTIRQRPRLLLGRSVCYLHLNVASEFFNISSFSGFGLSLFPPLTGSFDLRVVRLKHLLQCSVQPLGYEDLPFLVAFR